jgi:hypothetical protein
VHVLVLAPSSEPSPALTATLRHRAETHGARFTLFVPAGSGPAAESEAFRVAERLRVAGLLVSGGWDGPPAVESPPSMKSWSAPQRERVAGALARHVRVGEHRADWRLAS